MKIGGADGGHNGISSIILQIGVDFPRFRLGIHPKCKVSLNLSDFVLGRFDLSEQHILNQMFVLGSRYRLILDEGVEKAMNQTNKEIQLNMNKTANREYKTTFILDLRETEDDVAKVSSDIKRNFEFTWRLCK